MTVSKTTTATESRQLAQQGSRGNLTSLQRTLIALCDGVLTLFGLTLHVYTVATVPTASEHSGRTIYVSDGAGGLGTLATSNGTAWLRSDTGTPILAAAYAVATVPAAASYEGRAIYVSDGAGGSEILAFSDGTDWLRSDTGAAIAGA